MEKTPFETRIAREKKGRKMCVKGEKIVLEHNKVAAEKERGQMNDTLFLKKKVIHPTKREGD